MCTSLDCAQTKNSSMQRTVINTRLLITGYWTLGTKKKQCFNHGCHFCSVVGVCSGTRESGMSLGGNDGTKHDIDSSMRGSGNHTPPSKNFTINKASNHHLYNSPPTTIVASFTCYGTSMGRYGYLDLGVGSRKLWCGTPRKCCARHVV